MTRKTLLKGFKICRAVGLPNGPNVDDRSTVDVWLGALSGLSDEDFIRAMGICARTCKFFPTPAHIIQAAIPENIISAEDEWEKVVIEINRCCGMPGVETKGFENPVTCRVIASMTGNMGLNAIWQDSRDRSFVRKEFINHYNRLISSRMMQLLSGSEIKQVKNKNVNKH